MTINKQALASACVKLDKFLKLHKIVIKKLDAFMQDEETQDLNQVKQKLYELNLNLKMDVETILKEGHLKTYEYSLDDELTTTIFGKDTLVVEEEALPEDVPRSSKEDDKKILDKRKWLEKEEKRLEDKKMGLEQEETRLGKERIDLVDFRKNLDARAAKIDEDRKREDRRQEELEEKEKEVEDEEKVSVTHTVPTRHVSYKLGPNTMVYGDLNDKRSIMDWLFNIETNMSLANIPSNLKISIASSYLRGIAFQMVKRYHNEKNTDWNHFKKELIKTFLPPNYELSIRTRFLNLRQTAGFESYSRDFQLFSNQLPDMSKEDRFTCFLQGLRPETRCEIVLRVVKDLNEAIVIATQLEYTLGSEQTTSAVNYSPIKRFGDKRDKKDVECYFCHLKGHQVNECWKRQSKPIAPRLKPNANWVATPPQQRANDFKRADPKKCSKCKRMGHTAAFVVCQFTKIERIMQISLNCQARKRTES